MGRSLNRRIEVLGADLRGKAHAGVVTTLDQRDTDAADFETFCRRQLSRVKHTLGVHTSRFRRRRAQLQSWEHAGLAVQSRGHKQPFGAGSYATREALAREED